MTYDWISSLLMYTKCPVNKFHVIVFLVTYLKQRELGLFSVHEPSQCARDWCKKVNPNEKAVSFVQSCTATGRTALFQLMPIKMTCVVRACEWSTDRHLLVIDTCFVWQIVKTRDMKLNIFQPASYGMGMLQ